jgi:hypothetical protein
MTIAVETNAESDESVIVVGPAFTIRTHPN